MKLRLFYDGFERSTKVELLEEIFVGKMYVPQGFVSDGGSIPRFFWRLFNPLDGRYLRSYIRTRFHLQNRYEIEERWRYYSS